MQLVERQGCGWPPSRPHREQGPVRSCACSPATRTLSIRKNLIPVCRHLNHETNCRHADHIVEKGAQVFVNHCNAGTTVAGHKTS